MSSNHSGPPFYPKYGYYYGPVYSDPDESIYQPPTSNSGDVLRSGSSTDPSSQHGDDHDSFQNWSSDLPPDCGLHSGDLCQNPAPLIDETLVLNPSNDVEYAHVGPSMPLTPNTLSNLLDLSRILLPQAPETQPNPADFGPTSYNSQFIDIYPPERQGYSQSLDQGGPVRYGLVEGAAYHDLPSRLTPRYVGSQYGQPVDMAVLEAWNNSHLSPVFEGRLPYHGAMYEGGTARHLEATDTGFLAHQRASPLIPTANEGSEIPLLPEERGNVDAMALAQFIGPPSAPPTEAGSVSGAPEGCWACYAQKKTCVDVGNPKGCERCRGRVRILEWNRPCNKFKLQAFSGYLYPATLSESLSRTRIRENYTKYSYLIPHAQVFSVYLDLGSGLPFPVSVRVYGPRDQRMPQRTVVCSRYRKGGGIVRGPETIHVHPIALGRWDEDVARETRIWIDKTLRLHSAAWIDYNFGHDHYTKMGLRSVWRYLTAYNLTAAPQPDEPTRSMRFEGLSTVQKFDTVRYAAKLVILLTVMKNSLRISPRSSREIQKNVCEVFSIEAMDSDTVPMLLASGFKASMTGILELLIRRSLSGLTSMLRVRHKRYCAPIVCTVILLAVAVGLQQVSLDSVNHLRTASGDPPIRGISYEIAPMEQVLLDAIEYSRNLYHTYKIGKAYGDGLFKEDPSTRTLFGELLAMFDNIDQPGPSDPYGNQPLPLHEQDFNHLDPNDNGHLNVPRLVTKVIHGLLKPR